MGPTKANTGTTPPALTGWLRRLRPYLPTLIAFVVMLGAAIYAEQQNKLTHQHEARSAMQVEIGFIRAQLEGVLNADIELMRGLAAALSTKPDMDQTRFSALAARVIGTRSEVASLSVAPDMVITLLHPPDPNRAAMGLDFNHIPTQRAAAYRARDTGKPVLAGPVDLVQGERGFILRFPILTTSREGRHFRGLLSAVLDTDTPYAATGITQLTPELNLLWSAGTAPARRVNSFTATRRS